MEALGHLALILGGLRTQAEHLYPKLQEFLIVIAKVAGLRCAATGAGNRVPILGEGFSWLCYAKTQSRVMRRLFQASIHDEDHPERPLIESDNLPAADVCGP